MKSKPQLSFWQIWNMSFGFLGIQFGFSLQNANVPRIFQTLGAEIDQIPILFVAAPLTGLLVQPIIGYMSDKTWGRFGRRRPYFLVGALLATAALFIMPHSPYLWMAAGTLWVLDASINISMEPFRAFVGDMLPDRQRTMGFAMQTFFIGIGAVVASSLPWMMTNWFDISNTAPEGIIPDSVKLSFYLGGGAFLLAVLWTVFTTKEYSPEQLEVFEKERQKNITAPEPSGGNRQVGDYLRSGIQWLLAGLVMTALIKGFEWDFQLYLLSGGASLFGVMQLVTARLLKQEKTESGFYQIVDDLFHMPRTMKQLVVVQFFSWFAFYALWIYTIPAVTSFHFGSSDTSSQLYNDGADWAGVLLASYSGFTILAAFLIPVLAKKTTRKIAHMINLSLGGLGMISMYFVSDPMWLWTSMVGVGIAWGSILSIPYSLLASAVPMKKMGTYMGIFNFFIVVPQILAASILGLLVTELFNGQAIYALMLGGVSLILGGLASLRVKEPQGF